MKRKEIFELHKENDLINDILKKHKIAYEETMEERGFIDKMDDMNTEINELKKNIKNIQKESFNTISKQKSVNNGIVLIERKYRDVCEKHSYVDRLNLVVQREEDDNNVTGIEIKNQTLKKIVRRDPNKPLIRNVNSDKFFRGKLKTLTLRKEEEENIKFVERRQKNDEKRAEIERLKQCSDPIVEEIKGLEMSEASYTRLLDEWRGIVSKENQAGIDSTSSKVNKAQLEKKYKDKKEEFDDTIKKCYILEKKIKELQRAKMSQETALKKKKSDAEAAFAEEEWDTRFDKTNEISKNQSERGTKNLTVKEKNDIKKLIKDEDLELKKKSIRIIEDEAKPKDDQVEEKVDEEKKEEKVDEEKKDGKEVEEKKDEKVEEEKKDDKEVEDKPESVISDKAKLEGGKKEDQLKTGYDANALYNNNPNRTEIIIGQIYNKKFETLFDDQSCLLGHTSHSIIKILCNWNETNIVGIQFHYMTTQGHIIEGRFYGEHKVRMNNLKSGEWEIPLGHKITKVSCSYSKGLHWIDLTLNKEKVITLGNKKTDHKKEIRQVVDLKQNETIRFVSGGRALKSSTFTYFAFHVDCYDENDIQEELEGEYKSVMSEISSIFNFLVLGANNSVGKSSLINAMIGDKITKTGTSKIEAFQNDRFSFYDTPSFKNSTMSMVSFIESLFKNLTNGISGLIFIEDSTNIELNV